MSLIGTTSKDGDRRFLCRFCDTLYSGSFSFAWCGRSSW
jgi:hypothetical protein